MGPSQNDMDRELLILRHGHAAYDGGAENDFDRPLDKRGILACHVIAAQLTKEQILPERIISSSAVRATQTVLRVAKQTRIPMSHITWNPNLYSSSVEAWVQSVRELSPDISRLLICGHNPELEKLIEHLCVRPVERPDDGKMLTSGSLARLRVLVPWGEVGENCATLASISRPNDASVPVDI